MTDLLWHCLKNEGLGPALQEREAGQLSADVLEGLTNLEVYPRSITAAKETLYFLGRREKAKFLGLISGRARSGEPFARAAWPRYSLNSQLGKTSAPAGRLSKSWTTPCGWCSRKAGGKKPIHR